MSALRVIGKILSVCVAVQYFYWAVMQAGSIFHMCDAPSVDATWLLLAFVGAGIKTTEHLFPSLNRDEAKR